MKRVRCAIYTRKSSDEGLDQSFNSLDAQREACEAYIHSQKHEGWKVLPARYDDGGASGGNMDRDALQRLLIEIDESRVDMVVVYKIDRLTRSLADFAKLVERLDAAGASFVSVTQQFNTSTSMGRLTLNVLLSFAQFEREVTAERIRDKIAASKKKGLWMGGLVPLGYDKAEAGLVINQSEAGIVRSLFEQYLELKDVTRLKAWADSQGFRTKSRTWKDGTHVPGKRFARGHLYQLLSNPIYIGKIHHKGELYEGVHEAIVDQDLWDQVQSQREQNRTTRKSRRNHADKSPLAGKLFAADGNRFYVSHANKKGSRYRYYVQDETNQRLPAAELEKAITDAVRSSRSIRANDVATPFECIERVAIHPDRLTIDPNPSLEIEPIVISYRLRRRGFETKLVLPGTSRSEPDQTLVRRTLQAMDWLKDIKAGKSLSEVAAAHNVPTEYVSANLDLALLSPKVLSAIADGKHDPYFTATRLKTMTIPNDWAAQEARLLLR